jgi:hypothetical protein
MPTARKSLCANVVDDKMYLIGGSKPYYTWEAVPNVNEVYDPSTDTWTTKTPSPTRVSAYASAVVNNKIYVIGGSSNLTQIYDPESDTWRYGTPIPNAVTGAAAGATTGVMAPKMIYVIGGIGTFKLNQVYDPEKDAWSMGAQMPTARSNPGIAVVNDVLYAIGDYTENEQYIPFGFGVEAVPPIISIASPEKNATYSVNNVSLTFALSKPASWTGYSLDGQANVTITGNTSLTALSAGSHSLIVYASDANGRTGTSEIIYFTVIQETETQPQSSETLPTTLIVAATTIVAVSGVAITVGVASYKKKKSASSKT